MKSGCNPTLGNDSAGERCGVEFHQRASTYLTPMATSIRTAFCIARTACSLSIVSGYRPLTFQGVPHHGLTPFPPPSGLKEKATDILAVGAGDLIYFRRSPTIAAIRWEAHSLRCAPSAPELLSPFPATGSLPERDSHGNVSHENGKIGNQDILFSNRWQAQQQETWEKYQTRQNYLFNSGDPFKPVII